MTLAARSSVPTRASSWASRRPGVTALPPAQHAWARARDGEHKMRPRTGTRTSEANSLNLERRSGIVLGSARDGQADLPEAGHEEIDIGDQVLAVRFGRDGRHD